MRKILFISMFIVIGLIVILTGGVGAAYYMNSPTNYIKSNGVQFSVPNGESLHRVSDNLERKNIIRSKYFLLLYSKIFGTANNIKSGNYYIEKGSTARDIHNLIVSGRQIQKEVTIPEGWTMSMTAERFVQAGIVESKQAFLKAAEDKELLNKYSIPGNSAEGYLFPDTYRFTPGMPGVKIVTHLIESFYEHLEKEHSEYKKLTEKELYKKITLASIVEREYRVPKEAPKIASVFYNRLKEEIALGSCATVGYVISEIRGKEHPEYLSFADTQIESPYNTYIHKGLPPGPIANPGIIAIDAVFNPADTDYYYFVLKDTSTGEHFFSKNLQDHRAAREAFKDY